MNDDDTDAVAVQLPQLHVPTKTSENVDFGPAVVSYIQQAFGEEGNKYLGEIGQLNQLRQDSQNTGKDLASRDVLYKYYGQLELLDLRFPIDEKHVKIVFPWYVPSSIPDIISLLF